jgi:UDP-N-acetylglucosamine 2-epimerase
VAAGKIHFPAAHVESGLRSFDWRISEEINRVLVDPDLFLLFFPMQTAMESHRRERITEGVS